MLIKEYRIPLPLTVEEYHIGQLYAVAETSKANTGGGEGVEVLKNEPFNNFPLLGHRFSSGQYTYKIYKIESKLPAFIRMLASKGVFDLHEEAWNAYPYCRTLLKNPGYMKNKFLISVESLHLPNNGFQNNVHELPPEKLQSVQVVPLNIASPVYKQSDYKPEEDPLLFKSRKTGRGPLVEDTWINTFKPIMTCYKLISVDFQMKGVQNKVENFIHHTQERLLHKFHRQVFCSLDDWHGFTIADIRRIEDEAAEELQKLRTNSQKRGFTA